MKAEQITLHMAVFIVAAVCIYSVMGQDLDSGNDEAPESGTPLCPVFSFGSNCELSCSNCSDTCDSEFGVCRQCKPGHKYPFTACTQECDMYEFGINCEGNCLRKCGTDCLERIHGTCPVSIWYYSSLLFMGLVTLSAGRIIYDLFRMKKVKIRKMKVKFKISETGKSIPELLHPLIDSLQFPACPGNEVGSGEAKAGKITQQAAGASHC